MYRGFLRGFLAVALASGLAACGAEAPTEDAAASELPPIEQELPVIGPERHILAFGDSLFAGYNLEPDQGYPEKLQAALRASGVNARVTDAGVSGDTTAAGRQRIGFVLDNMETPPELVIVELGGNDMLRQLPPAEARQNLAAILEEVTSRDIPVLLMGMRAPPNLGPDYQREFDGIYADLAAEYGAALVPFFLQSIFEQPALFLPDKIHPTPEGVDAIVADTMDDVVAALPEVQ